MVFLNRGPHFEARELPLEAQVAPVFAINVADVDGDGHEDVFLSQNFFATRPEVPARPICDSSRRDPGGRLRYRTEARAPHFHTHNTVDFGTRSGPGS
jgi:hypothetical protein